MTYRASLGTRGELRRIAAEAETATIDRVRPWHRRVQPCRLAPHVVVPQWIRSEQPAKPRTPPPMLFTPQAESRQFVTELIDRAVDSACAKAVENNIISMSTENHLTQNIKSSEMKGTLSINQPNGFVQTVVNHPSDDVAPNQINVGSMAQQSGMQVDGLIPNKVNTQSQNEHIQDTKLMNGANG